MSKLHTDAPAGACDRRVRLGLRYPFDAPSMGARSAHADPVQVGRASRGVAHFAPAVRAHLVSVTTAVTRITRPGGCCVRGPIRASERRSLRRTRCAASMQVSGGEGWVRGGGSRFLQTDPVPGGSANDYDYANQDPINGYAMTAMASASAGSDGRARPGRRLSTVHEPPTRTSRCQLAAASESAPRSGSSMEGSPCPAGLDWKPASTRSALAGTQHGIANRATSTTAAARRLGLGSAIKAVIANRRATGANSIATTTTTRSA